MGRALEAEYEAGVDEIALDGGVIVGGRVGGGEPPAGEGRGGGRITRGLSDGGSRWRGAMTPTTH